MEGFGSQYDNTLDSNKMEQLNEIRWNSFNVNYKHLILSLES